MGTKLENTLEKLNEVKLAANAAKMASDQHPDDEKLKKAVVKAEGVVATAQTNYIVALEEQGEQAAKDSADAAEKAAAELKEAGEKADGELEAANKVIAEQEAEAEETAKAAEEEEEEEEEEAKDVSSLRAKHDAQIEERLEDAQQEFKGQKWPNRYNIKPKKARAKK